MASSTGLPQKYLGLSAWLWAASTLMSRTMYVPFDSAGGIRYERTKRVYELIPPCILILVAFLSHFLCILSLTALLVPVCPYHQAP